MRVKCKCGTILKIRDQLQGKKLRCPKCRGEIRVPAQTEGATKPPPMAPATVPESAPPIDEPVRSAKSAPGSAMPTPSTTAGSKKPHTSVEDGSTAESSKPAEVQNSALGSPAPQTAASGKSVATRVAVVAVVVSLVIGFAAGYLAGAGLGSEGDCPVCEEQDKQDVDANPDPQEPEPSESVSPESATPTVEKIPLVPKSQKRCNEGDAMACVQAANAISSKDPDAAYILAKRGCELNERYCSTQANLLLAGTGVKANKQAAFELYERTCLAGERWTCETEGLSVAYGHGKCDEGDTKIPEDKPPLALWRQYRCDYDYLRKEKGVYPQIPDLSSFNPERSIEALTASITDYYGKPLQFVGVIGISDYYNYKYMEKKASHRAFEFHPYRPSGEDLFDDYSLYLYGRRSVYEGLWRELSLQPDDEGRRYRNRLLVKVTVITDKEHGSDEVWTLVGIEPMIGWWEGLCCPKLETPMGEGTEPPEWPSVPTCSKEDPDSCLEQGYKAQALSSEKDAADAFALACEGGNRQACFILGGLYYLGLGVEKDATTSFISYKKACEAGHVRACTKVAIHLIAYSNGDTKQFNNGWELLKATCRNGDDEACSMKRELEAKLRQQ